MFLRRATLIAAVLLAAPAAAQEDEVPGLQSDGFIRFEVEGQDYSYQTVSFLFDTVRVGSGAVQPGNTSYGDILGIGGFENADGSGNSFHLSIGYQGTPAATGRAPSLDPPVLTWFPGGVEQPFWASLLEEVAQPQITFTRFEFDGESGHASGSFAGRICRVENLEAIEPDPGNCQEVSGSFDSALYRAF